VSPFASRARGAERAQDCTNLTHAGDRVSRAAIPREWAEDSGYGNPEACVRVQVLVEFTVRPTGSNVGHALEPVPRARSLRSHEGESRANAQGRVAYFSPSHSYPRQPGGGSRKRGGLSCTPGDIALKNLDQDASMIAGIPVDSVAELEIGFSSPASSVESDSKRAKCIIRP
jgi:hypothetical protein